MIEADQAGWKGSSRTSPWVLLVVLCFAYIIATLDRTIISLLIDPIRADLQITDTQFSLLQGPAFSLTYILLGLPVGMLVDRVARTRLVAVGIAFWSVMTAMCGAATSLPAMFAARMGVGAGEATLAPAAYSLIGDGFSKDRQGIALGVFAMSGLLGAGLSMVVGGFLIERVNAIGPLWLPLLGRVQPWQQTFLMLAIPGLVMTVLLLIVKEPERRSNLPTAVAGGSTWGDVGRYYRRNAAFLWRHHLGIGLANMTTLATLVWVPALYLRVHGWAVGEIGLKVGLMTMAGAGVGLWGGGWLSDRAMARGPQARLTVCAGATLIGAIAAALYPIVASADLALIGFAAVISLSSLPMGAGNAALQYVVPGNFRGRVSAIFFLSMGLIAMFGPPVVALVAAGVSPDGTAIRYGLAIALPIALCVSALLFATSITSYRRSITAAGGLGASDVASEAATAVHPEFLDRGPRPPAGAV